MHLMQQMFNMAPISHQSQTYLPILVPSSNRIHSAETISSLPWLKISLFSWKTFLLWTFLMLIPLQQNLAIFLQWVAVHLDHSNNSVCLDIQATASMEP